MTIVIGLVDHMANGVTARCDLQTSRVYGEGSMIGLAQNEAFFSEFQCKVLPYGLRCNLSQASYL